MVATLTVTPGETLVLDVGAAGQDAPATPDVTQPGGTGGAVGGGGGSSGATAFSAGGGGGSSIVAAALANVTSTAGAAPGGGVNDPPADGSITVDYGPANACVASVVVTPKFTG